MSEYLERGTGSDFLNPAQLVAVANRIRQQRDEPAVRAAAMAKYLQDQKEKIASQERTLKWWADLAATIGGMSDADLESEKAAVLASTPTYQTPDGKTEFFTTAALELLRRRSPRTCRTLQGLIAERINFQST